MPKVKTKSCICENCKQVIPENTLKDIPFEIRDVVQEARDKIEIKAQAAADEWVKDTLTDIKVFITSALNNNFEQKLKKILGFRDDGWRGDWQFDETNGRKSAILDELKDKLSAVAKTVLDELLTDEVIKSVQSDPAIKKCVLEQFKKSYKSYMLNYAEEKAKQISNKCNQELLQIVDRKMDGSSRNMLERVRVLEQSMHQLYPEPSTEEM